MRPLAERFYAKVDRTAGDESCWPWTGAVQRSRGGGLRGRIRLGGRGTPVVYAHRVALALVTGTYPTSKEAAHTCDNPICCNPQHLVWMTHKQNMHDYSRKHGAICVPKSPRPPDVPLGD
ncbi:MAG: HNH endonuclease signature motif containing protein [Conexibacter sp.]